MNKIKLLIAFFASATLLISCGQNAQIESTENAGSSETTETAKIEDSSSEDNEDMSEEVELIPVAVWAIIDVNQAGQITSEEFVNYYVAQAEDEDKLNEEEAQKKFQTLDKDADGQLTKEEATGEN